MLRRTVCPYVFAWGWAANFGPFGSSAAGEAWIAIMFGSMWAAYFLALEAAGFSWAPLFLGDRPLEQRRDEAGG